LSPLREATPLTRPFFHCRRDGLIKGRLLYFKQIIPGLICPIRRSIWYIQYFILMYRDGTLKIRYFFYCNFNRQNNILYTCHPSQPTWHPGLIHFKTSSIYDIRFLRKAANNSIEKKERIWRNRPKKTLSLQMWFGRLNF
jgi:hypothetical protein